MASQKKTVQQVRRPRTTQQEKDIALFTAIKTVVISRGFRLLTKNAIEKIHRSIGLVKPNVPRTEDVEDKASFVIGVGTMIVHVYTGFNLAKRRFNPAGSLEIVISEIVSTKRNTKRVFTRRFKREDGASEKIKEHVIYILKEISEDRRPQTSSGRWASLKEISQDLYFWVNQKETIIRGFFDNAPNDSLVLITQEQRERYDVLTRPAKGFERRRRDIKKPYRAKK